MITRRLAFLRGRLGRAVELHIWVVELPEGEREALELERRLSAAEASLDPPGPGLSADRMRSLVGRVGVRSLVAEMTGSDPLMIKLRRDERGGLVVAGHPELKASVSHSGRCVLCAAARTELGVDIEPNDRPEADEHLAARVCTRDERRWLQDLAPQLQRAALIRLWVRKEALAKALGIGLALPMATVDVRQAIPVIDGVADRTWSLRDVEARSGYAAAVATRGPQAATELKYVPPAGLLALLAPTAHAPRSEDSERWQAG